MSNAVSSHGTVIARQATPGGPFVEIAEMGDLQPPSLSRNTFDVTTQNDDIDAYVAGVLRRAEITFPVNFRWDETTHNHIAGLYKAIKDNTLDGYKITFPDATPWIFSGFVTNIGMEAPVDGAQRANVTIRPSGLMSIAGVVFGDV